jgi:hypothetical protein
MKGDDMRQILSVIAIIMFSAFALPITGNAQQNGQGQNQNGQGQNQQGGNRPAPIPIAGIGLPAFALVAGAFATVYARRRNKK